MTSTIILYNVGFSKEQNCVVDNLESYLNGLTPIYQFTEQNYIKIALDISIPLEIGQLSVSKPSFNYVKIINGDNTRPFYYYLTSPIEWRSKSVTRLFLSMDTLNTYKDLLIFSNKTIIKRQHKDRFIKDFYSPGEVTLSRKIDVPSEITGLTKYCESNTKITDSMNKKWYLVYANATDDDNSAVECFLVPEITTTFTSSGTKYNYSYFETGTALDVYLIKNVRVQIVITQLDETTLTLNCTDIQTWYIKTPAPGSNYMYLIGKGTNTNTYTFKRIQFSTETYLSFYKHPLGTMLDPQFSDNAFFQICHNSKGEITLNANGDYVTGSITAVNRTLPYIIKIIECPYCPLTLTKAGLNKYVTPAGVTLTFTTRIGNGVFPIVTNLIMEFNAILAREYFNELVCSIPSSGLITTLKDPIYESKLFHSDFYSYILDYDTFTKEIKLEHITPKSKTRPYYDLEYKQANTITSNLGFKIGYGNCTKITNERYDKYLLCNRNNEFPIYNSSYLNYLRNGYNYDVKQKNRQLNFGLGMTALQFAGGIAGMALSGATGGISGAGGVSLITSATMSLSNIIKNTIQTEANIEQKIENAKLTTNTASGADDLNLLNWYNENKLYITTYDISEAQKSNVFDLFYRTGYACNESGIPNLKTRYRFNYIQCEADFTTKANPEWQLFLPDILERFEKGVTYFHTTSDFEQKYENWESWII